MPRVEFERSPKLCFRIGDERFCLLLSEVREVALLGPLSRVPLAAAPVLGVMNLRGRIVLVLDLGLLLGRRTARQGSGTERLIVLDEGKRDLGLLVSEVVQISHLAPPVENGTGQPLEPSPGDLDARELAAKIASLLGGPAIALESK